MVELDIAQAASIGARAEQQDAAGTAQLGSGNGAALLVLADGLGGHADGAMASRLVIKTFDEAAKGGLFDETGGRRQALDDVIQEVNRRIHASTDPTDGHRSMASTAVAAIVASGTVRWISVGDSHLYVCRGGRLSKLNADHSQAGIMIRHGYSPNDEAVINARSVLVSALTGRAIEEIDNPAHDVALEKGDVVLLASDGLNTLSDTEIALIVDQTFERGSEAIAAALVESVMQKGLQRQDNVTVVVARVLGSGVSTSSGTERLSQPLTQTTTPTEIATTPVDQPPNEPPADVPPSPEPVTVGVPPTAPSVAAVPDASDLTTPIAPIRSGRLLSPGTTRPLEPPPEPPIDAQRRRLLLKILLTLLAAAVIASVIVTQTNCCGLP